MTAGKRYQLEGVIGLSNKAFVVLAFNYPTNKMSLPPGGKLPVMFKW
jgi:hypothetical protein